MTESAAEEWPEPPLAGAEAAAVLGALERQRATLAWKTSGLDADGLRATVGASSVTLGGLLKHLAHVEDSHFARLWLGVPVGAPWNTVDWDNDPDWAYRTAAEDTPITCAPSGGSRRPAPGPSSRRRSAPAAAWTSSARTSPEAANAPTSAASSWTWSRSTPAMSATPTSSASRSTA